ncbi:SHOCT domain-containing protein [Rhodoluna sp.]|uniref:SHOCT domain-containing protein n=1 Tax=Rhodoluna sp. TaxID=1969481 RepID=UPI0025D6205D|nr:SHOCT domain-containing protein [Rhodoluna sp.]
MDDKEAAKAAKREARENADAARKAKYEARQAALKEKIALQKEVHRAKMAEIDARSKAVDEELKRKNAETVKNIKTAAKNMKDAVGELNVALEQTVLETRQEFASAKAQSDEEWKKIKSDFAEIGNDFKEAGQMISDSSKDLLIKGPLGEEKRKDIRSAAGSDKKLEKTMLKDAKKLEKARVEAERLEKFGKRIADEFFWTRRVCIYEKGYVSVRFLTGGPNFDKPEKLVSISSNSQVFNKNTSSLFEKLHGDLYLTIVTASDTYSLRNPRPDTGDVRRMNKLVATGQAVIGRDAPPPNADLSNNPRINTEISTELNKLNELHSSGVLTDAEFTAAKAKILGL